MYVDQEEDKFITDRIDCKVHPKWMKPLSQGSVQAKKYVSALSKLFNEIRINQNNLWIMPTIGTQSVRIYFSDPVIYPISSCCQKPVYIDMEENLNGSIVCPNCNMVLVTFIHYFEHQLTDPDHFDQLDKRTLFRQKKKQTDIRNRLMYENLVSNKFKTKNLKKVLLNHSNSLVNNSKVILDNSKLFDKSPKNNLTRESFSSTKENNRLNPRQFVDQPKDGFILQVKTLKVKEKQNLHSELPRQFYTTKSEESKHQSPSNFEEEKKRSFDHQLSIEETRKIILDIFK